MTSAVVTWAAALIVESVREDNRRPSTILEFAILRSCLRASLLRSLLDAELRAIYDEIRGRPAGRPSLRGGRFTRLLAAIPNGAWADATEGGRACREIR
jgi:hypothetical protein